MKAINKITLKYLRQNRQRTSVTILGATLSLSLIMAVMLIGASFYHSIVRIQIDEFGPAHAVFEEVPANKVSIIESNKDVEVLYFSKPFSKARAGAEMYERYTAQNPSLLYPSSTYDKIDSLDDVMRATDEPYNVYIKYKNLKSDAYLDAYSEIDSALMEANVEVFEREDRSLMMFQGNLEEKDLILLGIIILLVFGSLGITAIFFIRNSFTISITERVRDFGVLSCIGATRRQIRHSVFFEACYIALFAIPLSFGVSVLAALVLILVMNNLIGEMLGGKLALFVPWQGVLGVSLFGLIILLLASFSAAIIASRYSPIIALRGNNDIKIKSKKIKTPAIISKIWGIGGVLAHKNLKRSRSKYRTTVLAIIVSVALFIGMSSFAQYLQKSLDELSDATQASVIIHSDIGVAKFRKMAEDLRLADFEYESIINTKKGEDNAISMKVLSREAFEKYAKKAGYSGKQFDEIAIMNNRVMTDRGERKGLDVKQGDTVKVEILELILTEQESENELDVEEELDVDEGIAEDDEDDDDVHYFERTAEVKIDVLTDKNFDNVDPLDELNCIFISENHPLAKLYNNAGTSLGVHDYTIYDSGRADDIQHYADTHFTSDMLFELYDNEQQNRTIRNFILLIEIFIFGFIAVVAIIGATNIFNTIVTNIASRAKEFAILKSVGMTKREFDRMIQLESIFYSTRALAIGIACGLGITLLVRSMFGNAYVQAEFIMPWLPIVASILVVFVMVLIVMRFAVRRIEERNIIETIRSESY